MQKNSSYVIQNLKMACRIVDGEAVILDLTNSKLYSLNPVATLIWEMSEDRTRIKDIVDKIVEEFEVERSQAEADCLQLIDDFAGKRLLLIEENPEEN